LLLLAVALNNYYCEWVGLQETVYIAGKGKDWAIQPTKGPPVRPAKMVRKRGMKTTKRVMRERERTKRMWNL